MKNEKIRKAEAGDLDQIMDIYQSARSYMKSCGNADQWGPTYPSEALLLSDIEKGQLFVLVAEDEEERLLGVFAFIIGPDPAYKEIRGEGWLSDLPYGTIHRIASGGRSRGFFKSCLDFCRSKMDHIRIDTHRDNKIMQEHILKNGFSYRGLVNMADGSERLAYEILY